MVLKMGEIMFKTFHKRKSLFIFSSFLVFFLVTIAFARLTGIAGRTSLGNGLGCSCHGASSSNVVALIIGPDTLQPNETGTYVFTLAGGPSIKGGMDFAASNGSLSAVSPGLRKDAATGDIVHDSPGTFTSGFLTYAVDFTAPATLGTVTLAAAGNSVNDSGTNSGDEWNFAPDKIVTIVNPTSVDNEPENIANTFSLQQNYPNPFNPSTKIQYNLPESDFVTLFVYNATGQKVRTLVNSNQSIGSHTIKWDSRNDNGKLVSSGIYYYILNTGIDKALSRKMILQR